MFVQDLESNKSDLLTEVFEHDQVQQQVVEIEKGFEVQISTDLFE